MQLIKTQKPTYSFDPKPIRWACAEDLTIAMSVRVNSLVFISNVPGNSEVTEQILNSICS